MVKAKKQPELSSTVNSEVATPEVAPQVPVQEIQKPPKPNTGKGPKVYKSPSGFTIEDF
jgi:hypothetical protein